MENCGNFLEYAGSKCGLDVGYGKLILVYKEKSTKSVDDLSAENINAEIAAGTIIGVVKGWYTVAGASVAETSVERVGTGEMKLIRAEIAADTLTFEANMGNRETIDDLVRAGSLQCILIDDQGNAFGEVSETAGKIDTMLLNFSTKTTSSFQHDNATEKTVSVMVRYLVKDLGFVAAATETEMVESKTLVMVQFKSAATLTATSAVFDLVVSEKSTNKAFADAITATDVSVLGANVTGKTAAYVAETGVLTLTLTGTGFNIVKQNFIVSLSGANFYSKSSKIGVSLGE